MLTVNNVTLRFGSRVLFEDVNLKLDKGNCYGVIGANGAGKSTFLKIISGEIEPSKGDVSLAPKKRMSILKQDHFAYDNYTVLETVIMGNSELYKIMKEKDAIYSKPDFDEKDGMKAAKLEERFAELDGWNAETDALKLLSDLNISNDKKDVLMKNMESQEKVKVLLANALFGNPDLLLLDEPTNDLDQETIHWLQDFLIDYENTVVVVSHDRYFLNKVCTHILDIDYGKIKLFPGNYDFWYQSSQLLLKQAKEQNKKKEDKIKELQAFIQRFSANLSKSRQATSRKKSLEKIELEEIKPSNRRYPYIDFKPEREAGAQILEVKKLSSENNELKNINFKLENGDKVVVKAKDETKITLLFDILAGKVEKYNGEFKYGQTITSEYVPKDNAQFFNTNENLVNWLRQYSKEKDETYIRSFLGRMLFSGEEALKEANVLSGGEKVRCMFSKAMLSGANLLILDEPTNHLDMESITALNEALKNFKGVLLFSTHDHELAQTVANKVIEITDDGVKVFEGTYNNYLGEK